jgi:small GTP-binding protein
LLRKKSLEYDLLSALLKSKGPLQAAWLAHLQSGCLERVFVLLLQALQSVPTDKRGKSDGDRDVGIKLVRELEASYPLGRFLQHFPRIVLCGSPNAGKSTLFNALLGEQRALTSKIPGTTRDPVEANFLLEGFPVRLFDLPGARGEPSSPLDAMALYQARRLERDADLFIHLLEYPKHERQRPNPKHAQAVGSGAAAWIDVINKADLMSREEHSRFMNLENTGSSDVLLISALKERGLSSLMDKVSEGLGLKAFSAGYKPLIINKKQLALVRKAGMALRRNQRDPGLQDRLEMYLKPRLGLGDLSRRDLHGSNGELLA